MGKLAGSKKSWAKPRVPQALTEDHPEAQLTFSPVAYNHVQFPPMPPEAHFARRGDQQAVIFGASEGASRACLFAAEG